MVGAFGEVQVMDWGLAKQLNTSPKPGVLTVPQHDEEVDAKAQPDATGDQTQMGTILGTPNYMAPEQARGESATIQSDVFALGGILCAILTGKAVFGGKTVIETVQQAASGDTQATLQRLDELLASHGVRSLKVLGETLDPHRMRVVGVEAAAEAANVADGTVLREVQRGFLHEGELLRVAQVIVSKKATRT